MEPLSRQLVVELKAGQGVYYNNLLIHRGIYPSRQQRATLHAAMALAEAKDYPHDLEPLRWMAAPGFRESLPQRLLGVYDNWLRQIETQHPSTASVSGYE
jgi:hypothetical protein